MVKLSPWFRFGSAFTLGGAVGAIAHWCAEHWYHDHRRPDANEWEALGTWFGALVTFVGVVVAARGFIRWEERHRLEQFAAIASEACVATAELCAIVEVNLAKLGFTMSGLPIEAATLAAWKSKMVDGAEYPRFRGAETKVELYVDAYVETAEEVRRILEPFGGLRTLIAGFTNRLEEAQSAAPAETGIVPEKALHELRRRVDDKQVSVLKLHEDAIRTNLRPFALLQVPLPKRPLAVPRRQKP